ncbi:ribonuclease P [Candidatus Woesearchaeota archaeon]|nr:MAG: ribonuclease P [Candidatus Woesearchaeota archaeon]
MRRNKSVEKKIALERIDILMTKAEQVFSKNKSLANRYVTLSRKIAMKYNLRFPKKHKRKFCKHCYKFLMPGVNARVRTRNGKVVYYCFECKKHSRIPY